MDSCLTLDIGNTNASLAFVSFVGAGLGSASAPTSASTSGPTPTLEFIGSWSREDDELDRLMATLEGFERSRGIESDGSRSRRVGISAVGSHERERAFADRLGALGWDVAVRPDAGLSMKIDHPETCGTDRQYAMRAALEGGEGRSVLVVDAGTALTVDAGELRPLGLGQVPGGGGGFELAFLGGAIALGPGSLAEAIMARGARLARFEIEPAAPALGRSTIDALRAGVSVGFRGTVRELCREVCEEAFGGTQGVAAYLTGGARAFARSAVGSTFPEGFQESAHLVHVGLAHAVRSAGKGS